MAVVLVFLNLSTSLVVVLFLLLLTLHPSQPDSVSRPTDPPSPDGRHQQNNSPPHLTVRQRVLDRLLLHENKPPGRQRQKRQAFDFGMNTPAPKPTTTTEGDTASTVNSSESSPGGGGSGGLVDPAHESTFQSADTAGTAPSTTTTTTTPCFGFNMCFLGFQCENGGTCVYNATTCLVSCSCPPPYNDPQFYDQLTCRSLGTLPPSVNSTTGPTAASSSDGAVTTKEPGCFGVNMCNHGFSCENGGTCFYNTTSCRVRCLCPPPYNDSQFYDQLSCGLLPTDPPPSSSSSPAPPPLPPTTLRPLSERQCRDATCIHGYCNATDFTRDPCRCDPGWKSFFCDVGCFKQCGNGGVCELFDYPLNKEKCVCLDTWIGENCTERKPEPQEHVPALLHWLNKSFPAWLGFLVANTDQVHRHTNPVHRHTNPVQRNTNPVHRHTNPVQRNTKPVIRHTNPVQRNTNPAHIHTNPVHRHTNPVHRHTNPVHIHSNPVHRHTNPVHRLMTNPVIRHTNPVNRHTNPVNRHTNPVYRHTNPVPQTH